MESRNSSSMPSSSGADDDIDSKAESSMSMTIPVPMPLFLDPHALSLPNYYNLNNNFLPSSLMFEPDCLPHGDYSSQPQPPQNPVPITNLHLDTFYPGPNCTGHGHLPASTSLSPGQTMSVLQGMAQASQYLLGLPSALTTNEPMKLAKKPRKRTRASRRAPTTILTTDTSNFRAMVQEFTGFPAQPFSGSWKLDLFGSGSIFRSSHHGHDPLSQMFPLRPSARKLHHPPLMPDSGNNTNSNANANSIINNSLMTTVTSTTAQMGTTANPNDDAGVLLLNLSKHPSGNNENHITLPNSDILEGFPSLRHDCEPLEVPGSSSLHHFEANSSNPSIQDQLGSRWDGLQARTINRANANNDHDHSRQLNYEDYDRGTQTGQMNHRHNNDKGLESRDVDNWFWPV